MLSPSIALMLDHVRGEFGIQANVLDVNLASILGPERQHRFSVRAGSVKQRRMTRVPSLAVGEAAVSGEGSTVDALRRARNSMRRCPVRCG